MLEPKQFSVGKVARNLLDFGGLPNPLQIHRGYYKLRREDRTHKAASIERTIVQLARGLLSSLSVAVGMDNLSMLTVGVSRFTENQVGKYWQAPQITGRVYPELYPC